MSKSNANLCSFPRSNTATAGPLQPAWVPGPCTSSNELDFSLEPILGLLKHEWVWDFFFAPKFDVHEQLQYAAEQSTLPAIEYEVKLAHQFPVNNESTVFNEKGHMLILPSFSMGNISVGFVVEELFQSSGSSLQPPLTLFRAARDDIDTCFISISEDPSAGLVYFTCIRLISPTCRENFVINFHYDSFRSAVKSVRGGRFDENLFRRALIKSVFCVQSRPCPICDCQPIDEPCACELPVRQKRHPLDLYTDSTNLSLYLGHYDGIFHISVYPTASIPPFTSRSAAHCSTLLLFDSKVRKRLANWALLQAKHSRLNPVPRIQMNTFPACARTYHAADPINFFALSALLQRMNEMSLYSEDLKPDDTGVDGNTGCSDPLFEMFGNNDSGQQGDITIDRSADDQDIGPLAPIPVTEPTRPTETMYTTKSIPDNAKGYGHNESTSTSCLLSSLPANDSMEVPLPPLTEQNSLSMQKHTTPPCAPTEFVAVVPTDDRGDLYPVHVTERTRTQQTRPFLLSNPVQPVRTQTMKIKRLKPLTIAPAPIELSNGCSEIAAKQNVADERKRKKELRKIYNREMAHRSNAKRKLQTRQTQKGICKRSSRGAELS